MKMLLVLSMLFGQASISYAQSTNALVTCANGTDHEWMRVVRDNNVINVEISEIAAINFLQVSGVEGVQPANDSKLTLAGFDADRTGFQKWNQNYRVLVYDLRYIGFNTGKMQLRWKYNDSILAYDFYDCQTY